MVETAREYFAKDCKDIQEPETAGLKAIDPCQYQDFDAYQNDYKLWLQLSKRTEFIEKGVPSYKELENMLPILKQAQKVLIGEQHEKKEPKNMIESALDNGNFKYFGLEMFSFMHQDELNKYFFSVENSPEEKKSFNKLTTIFKTEWGVNRQGSTYLYMNLLRVAKKMEQN